MKKNTDEKNLVEESMTLKNTETEISPKGQLLHQLESHIFIMVRNSDDPQFAECDGLQFSGSTRL